MSCRQLECGDRESELAADKLRSRALMMAVCRQSVTRTKLDEIMLREISGVQALSQYNHINSARLKPTRGDLTQLLERLVAAKLLLNCVEVM